MTHETTRRTVIAGMLAAPAAAAVPAIAATPTGGLAAKIAKVRHGMAVARQHDHTVGDAASRRSKAAKAEYERACTAIPHVSFDSIAENGHEVTWTTSSVAMLAVAQTIAPGKHGHRADVIADAQKLLDAHAEREAERERLRKVYLDKPSAEWTRYNEEQTRLSEIWIKDEEAVFSHPCTSAAELVVKLTYAVEQEAQAEEVMEHLLADARRLAAAGRA